jgi:hypothetical protein
MMNQINTQEIIKKFFLNIFEVSHLFDVSAITVRRYIKNIFKEITETEEKLNLSNQNDKAKLYGELENLSAKARKRVIGQTKSGESLYLLELANKEAFENWQLRPTIKAVIQGTENIASQGDDQLSIKTDPVDNGGANMSTQKSSGSTQKQEVSNQKLEEGTQRIEQIQWSEADSFGQKYIQLLESQLLEKDDTIRDLRETNKFLSITNGKLNEHLRLLLEKPGKPIAEDDK